MRTIQNLLLCTTVFFAGSAWAADAAVKEDVKKAAKALADKGNYSWRTTMTLPDSSQFRPGPTEGRKADGLVHVKMTFNDNTTEAVVKDQKVAIKTEDAPWQSAAELEDGEGRGRFMAARMRNFQAPAEQVLEILNDVKDLRKEGDAYTGELTEAGAKNLMRFRRGGDGPQISDAKGTVKFWTKEGVLSKFEYKVSGSMDFNGNNIDLDRTTTTEIKEVGTTKVSVPEPARAKLG